jgi:lipopolysaccharide transport system permease protein
MSKRTDPEWDLVIKPDRGWFDLRLGDLWQYRTLVYLFFKRDFVTFYKQTILGPLWYIIQPLFNTVVFTIVFGKIAKIPTDGIPPFLFYLAGNVIWGYFSNCLTETSKTFTSNAQVFGKVYFPRLTVPISVVLTGVVQFAIQFSIFLAFYVYYIANGIEIRISLLCFALPLILLQVAILGFGVGILISSITTKYRDLGFALGMFVQLWMYLTPIVYPLSQVPEKYRLIFVLNPMTSVVELFRAIFFGSSSIEPLHVLISASATFIVFGVGILTFSKVERTFMDTV